MYITVTTARIDRPELSRTHDTLLRASKGTAQNDDISRRSASKLFIRAKGEGELFEPGSSLKVYASQNAQRESV